MSAFTDFFLELRQAARAIRATPGVSAVIVGTLAVAIGANTAMFSVVEAVVLRPLPYRAPQSLVTIMSIRTKRPDAPFSLPEYIDYRLQARSLDGLAALANWSANYTARDRSERLQGMRVSANLFDLLGTHALVGRLLTDTDDDPAAPRVAVLASGAWQRLFGARPDIVGQRVRLNAEEYTVVGVYPGNIPLPIKGTDVAVPLSPARDPWTRDRNSTNFLRFVGRVRPNSTMAQVHADLTRICDQLRQQYPVEYAPKRGVGVADLSESLLGDAGKALLFLFAAVGIVLAIASANLANLLLLRGRAKSRMLAIRMALGASPARIALHLATETLVLAALGGTGGLLIAVFGLRALIHLGPADLTRLSNAAIDPWALLFAAALTFATAFAVGLLPILELRQPPVEALRGGRSTGTRAQLRVRRGIVALEVASAFVLVLASVLLAKSLARVQSVDLGFQPNGLFVARVTLPRASYADSNRMRLFVDRLTARLRQEPEVQSLGAASIAPLTGLLGSVDFVLPDAEVRRRDETPSALYRVVTPGYLETLHATLLKGRFIAAGDRENMPYVVVINRALADKFFGAVNPVGRRLVIEPTDSLLRKDAEIIGVTENLRDDAAQRTTPPMIFVAEPQLRSADAVWLANNQFWLVSVRGQPAGLERAFQSALREIEPDAAASNAGDYSDYVRASLSSRRFHVGLMLLFALVAVLLAMTGTYTVMSYSVSQRVREMAVRVALGAPSSSIMRLVLREGLTPMFYGLALGVVVGLASGRVLASMLYAVAPTDAWAIAGTIALLSAIGLAAIAVPARRAIRVDPLLVLQS